jgi:hypothetical protein
MVKTKKEIKTDNHNKTSKLRKQVLPDLTKKQITKLVYPITKEKAIASFLKLRETDCAKVKPLDKTGLDFVNFFTAVERLNTQGRLHISFFDTYYHFNEYYNSKPYFRNGLNNAYKGRFFKEKDLGKKVKILKGLFSLYLGNIGVFRPILVKDIICRYRPRVMLDFTMGWGGRLVGACCENIEKYIGIDLNTNLELPYREMVDTLKPLTTTKVELYFKSALDVDYSKMDYDFVLTSPPYYNLEMYNKSKQLSKEEWTTTFYIPVFTKTFENLKQGGHYCLNVPLEIYEDICMKILGPCTEKIPLGKRQRNKKDMYNEYIYVWKK